MFLEQTFPRGKIMLIEVERKGLGSTFALFCSSKKCADQTSLYSFDVSTAGNNLTVHCMNHRANLAMRCIGCERSLRAQRMLKGRQNSHPMRQGLSEGGPGCSGMKCWRS